MTPDELVLIKARADAATPGPWIAETENGSEVAVTARRTPITWDDHGGFVFTYADAEFIAYARTDVPRLHRAVEGLWEARERVEARNCRLVAENERLKGLEEVVAEAQAERDDAWRVASEQTRLERERAEKSQLDSDAWRERAEQAEEEVDYWRDMVKDTLRCLNQARAREDALAAKITKAKSLAEAWQQVGDPEDFPYGEALFYALGGPK